MNKRMLQMLAVVIAFLGVIGFVKFEQIRAAIAQGRSWAPPPEAVTTTIATAQRWPLTIEATGSVSPVQGVTLSADQPGVVDSITFESGARVRAGATLVLLDTREERAQLASAEAQRDLANNDLERSSALLQEKVVAQADYDQVAARAKQAEAEVNAIRAAIARKTIRAPFDGIVGIREVNLGQYLHSGDPIVPLQSEDPVYVDFSVPQQQVAALRVGAQVQAATDGGAPEAVTGRITAINPVVDETTRNVKIQATFDNPKRLLRPGAYVNVRVELGTQGPLIALPASAINFAPFGNSVFIVEKSPGPDGKPRLAVRQQFVKLGTSQGDRVVIEDGVKAGEEVVTSGVFKLRPGAAVQVNNEVRPSDQLTPKPENS